VFADPGNQAARTLCAAALEALGFASESATWRNAYLLAARELRVGVPAARRRSMSYDLLKAVPMEMFLDCLAIRLVAERASGHRMRLAWHIFDAREHWALTLANEAGIAAAIASGIEAGQIAVDGDAEKVYALLGMLDEFEPMFKVVEP
jgi:alkyl sulfatase BDS1-like metallo-beta-lactamase superfamily hydrolase